MKITTALSAILLAALCGCGSAEESPFIAARADAWRASIAEGVPVGSDLRDAVAFFELKGLSPRFVDSEKTLYAPDNIEPEPKSLMPFDAGLIKSYDIRCRFSDENKLVSCSVEPSTKRWPSARA